MQQRLTTKEAYEKQINIIVEYINNNLDGSIELTALAELSNFSPFHFHRIMRAFLGEPIGAYIVRMRMETAARLLRHTRKTVQEIAFEVGYDMPSSLSKTFRQFYAISPTEYRNNKNYTIMKPTQLNDQLAIKAPKILDLDSKQTIYLKQFGEYSELDFESAWGELWQFVKENKLFSAGIEHIGIYHDDPRVTEANKLRTDICLVIKKPAEAKGAIGVKEIAGGRYAMFLYQGSYEFLGNVYDYIHSEWLPDSGCQLRNVPCFEKYVSHPDRVAPEKLKTEIYIPIE